MCGITGYWNTKSSEDASRMRETITRMTDVMSRRGPDSGGVWLSPTAGFALGHRRLAIRELSQAGAQPMATPCGRYVLSYNGEIYNADELRLELTNQHGLVFRGHSDTEVILQACALWGVETAVKRLIGMFAFAFWDYHERKLFLVRDRMGIKPLYWGSFDGLFLFGSELKAILQHPNWPKEINRDAIGELLRCCFIPAPLSIYQGIEKLRPGRILQIDHTGKREEKVYWDAREVMLQGISSPLDLSEDAQVEALEKLLRGAVKCRMVSDVPLGAFLSGGIDSSLVTALMQAESSRPVKTFSIGFEESEYNEAPYAKAVARHLGTDHTEAMMASRQAWDLIPRMPDFYDEPFADSSQLPTSLLSALTRKHVTVALSGDGGDELFTGYERYFNFMNRFPGGDCEPWKKALARAAAPLLSPAGWDKAAGFLPAKVRPFNFGARLHGFAKRAQMTSSALYRQIGLGHWPNPAEIVLGAREVPSIFDDRLLIQELPEMMERMPFLDSVNYLPDDILVKVDRASMAYSLEARVPLIDHRVYEFSWKLPRAMRVREGKGKWILRRVLERYVPRELFERPKMGFGVPIDHWLRGPLKDWAEDLLEPSRMRQEGFIQPEAVREVWQKHLKGSESYHYSLWDVLMFQAWLRRKPCESSNTEPLEGPSAAENVCVAAS